MEVIPAIDLMNRQCVRLHQGDFSRVTTYSTDPLELARRYRAAGLGRLHVVDLDGARTGSPRNMDLITAMASDVGVSVQAGGGLRQIDRALTLRAAGADRVVVGSVAAEMPDTALEWLDRLGPEHLVLAFDVRVADTTDPAVLTRGWLKESGNSLWALMDRFCARGARHFLCTDVARDGTLAGPNLDLYRECVRRFPGAAVIASGGVGSLADLHQLATTGAAAVVTGKALLDGRLTLEEIESFARRIIPCLDVRDDQVVKGIQFRNHEVVGGIVELATRYRDEGADELVFYDITASPEGRSVDRRWINRIAEVLDIPFCVAGGIRSVAEADEVLRNGADKISINSPALADPRLITDLARRFGSQCVVVGVDSREEDGTYRVYRNTGDPASTEFAGVTTAEWVAEVQDRGAGEIVLNCMNQDGVRQGYDLEQLEQIRAICSVPLIASGGAGAMEHFAEVFSRARVDGALAASVFHRGLIHIGRLKGFLHQAGIEVRP